MPPSNHTSRRVSLPSPPPRIPLSPTSFPSSLHLRRALSSVRCHDSKSSRFEPTINTRWHSSHPAETATSPQATGLFSSLWRARETRSRWLRAAAPSSRSSSLATADMGYCWPGKVSKCWYCILKWSRLLCSTPSIPNYNSFWVLNGFIQYSMYVSYIRV